MTFVVLAVLPLSAWLWVHGTPAVPSCPAKMWRLRPRFGCYAPTPDGPASLLVNWLLSSCWDVHTFRHPWSAPHHFAASVIGAILGFAIAAAAVRVIIPVFGSTPTRWVVLSGAMPVTAMVFSVTPQCRAHGLIGAVRLFWGLMGGRRPTHDS